VAIGLTAGGVIARPNPAGAAYAREVDLGDGVVAKVPRISESRRYAMTRLTGNAIGKCTAL